MGSAVRSDSSVRVPREHSCGGCKCCPISVVQNMCVYANVFFWLFRDNSFIILFRGCFTAQNTPLVTALITKQHPRACHLRWQWKATAAENNWETLFADSSSYIKSLDVLTNCLAARRRRLWAAGLITWLFLSNTSVTTKTLAAGRRPARQPQLIDGSDSIGGTTVAALFGCVHVAILHQQREY